MKKYIKSLIKKINRRLYGTIIMAHHVYEDIVFNDTYGISLSSFKEFIELNNKKIVSLNDLLSPIKKKELMALTFDDGYEDIYNIVFPVCLKMQIPFTVFLVADFLDKPGFLTSEEVKIMLDSGLLNIGSHGYSHIELTNKDIDLQKEIYYSKKILEEKFHVNIYYYAFSHGQYDKKIVKTVFKAGYEKTFGASYFSKLKGVLPRSNIVSLIQQ